MITRACGDRQHGWCGGRVNTRPFYWPWRKCQCNCHTDERIQRMKEQIRLTFQLEEPTMCDPTPVRPAVSVAEIQAAIESTKLPERTLIVHPDIDNLAMIKQEASKLSLNVVFGSRQVMRPGEAYVVMADSSFIKKESS